MLLLHYMLKIIKTEAEFFYLLKLQIKTPVQDILTLHIAKLNRLSSYLTNVVICRFKKTGTKTTTCFVLHMLL